jgi:ribosomal protein L34E
MARYRCPYCHPRPVLVQRRSNGALHCGHCGDPLERVLLVRPLPALVGLLVLGGLALTAAAQHPSVMPSAPPQLRPQDYPLSSGREAVLHAQLEAADRRWQPRAEPLPGGGTRYVYKRRAGDPALSVEQIKRLIQNPPRFDTERRAIDALLVQLRSRGVRVVLGPPRKAGAAGEWEPRARTLRIRPDVPAKGSREFAMVLNHEAIHVAQSCRRGLLELHPQPLGLSRAVDAQARRHLSDPLYAKASPRERALEEEAYANQHRLDLGARLVQVHCRMPGGKPLPM